MIGIHHGHPDGRRLSFDRQDDGYNWIYVIDADGTGLRRLTENFNYDPVWTPDGRISYWTPEASGSWTQMEAVSACSQG